MKVVKSTVKKFEFEAPSNYSIFDRTLGDEFAAIYAHVKAKLPSTVADEPNSEESGDEVAEVFSRDRAFGTVEPLKRSPKVSNSASRSVSDAVVKNGGTMASSSRHPRSLQNPKLIDQVGASNAPNWEDRERDDESNHRRRTPPIGEQDVEIASAHMMRKSMKAGVDNDVVTRCWRESQKLPRPPGRPTMRDEDFVGWERMLEGTAKGREVKQRKEEHVEEENPFKYGNCLRMIEKMTDQERARYIAFAESKRAEVNR